MKSTTHTIVIRCPHWIGDAVMAIPAMTRIRELFHEAQITAIATTPIAQLLREEQLADEFFTFSNIPKRRLDISRAIESFLRPKQYDLGFLLTGSFSSAWQFWRGGITERIGFSGCYRTPLLTQALSKPLWIEHDALTYQRLLIPYGLDPIPPIPKLTVRDQEKEEVSALLQSRGHHQGKKLIVINPGAAYGTAKCWPKEYFQKVIQELISTGGITCVCIGDAKSAQLVQGMIGAEPQMINLCNQTTIRQLMGLLAIADGLITNDSGPMHIGSALHTPLVALFGSTDPRQTGPLGSGKVLYKGVECSPCFRRTCNRNFTCMHAITPHEVLEHLWSSIQ